MLLEAPFRQLAEVARRSEAELPTTFSSKRLSLPAVGARAPAPPAGVSTLTTPAGAGPPFRARRFEGRFEGRLGAEWVAGDEPAVGASTLTPCSCRCLVAGLTCPAACALSAARAPGSRESEPKPHLRVLAEAAALSPCIAEDREARDEACDEVIRGHQRSSEVIRGHQRSSEARDEACDEGVWARPRTEAMHLRCCSCRPP